MSWIGLPLTGGVVRTRNPSALRPEIGELQRSSHLRLRPGDLEQLHIDDGRSRIIENLLSNTGTIVAMRIVQFEGAAARLLYVVNQTIGGSVQGSIYWSYLGSSETTLVLSMGGETEITKADIVHSGNEYFVLTDQGNYVITVSDDGESLSSRSMGMTRTKAGVTLTGTVDAGQVDAPWSTDDYVVYWITEYDSVNDVESSHPDASAFNETSTAAGYVAMGADNTEHPVITIQPVTNGIKTNSNADKYRIYRAFVGNGATGKSEAIQYVNETTGALIGGLLEEIDIPPTATSFTYTDDGGTNGAGTKHDPIIPYPVVGIDPFGGGGIFEMLVKPEDATLGAIFHNSLVLNRPDTSKQILNYSPPGKYEYQPAPYFIPFISESQDEIIGMKQLNESLFVLTTAAAYRVSYLPLQGLVSGQQGRVLSTVTSKHGCVGRRAMDKIETSQGELMVWLSPSRLLWSDGQGWDDACPDWSVEEADFTADIRKTVVINNPAKHRIELYQPAQPNINTPIRRWDFYYHPTLMKSGKMRLMGPTELLPDTGEVVYGSAIIDATVADVNGKHLLYTTDGVSVWQEGIGNPNQDGTFLTGHVTSKSRFMRLAVTRVGLTHTSSNAPLIREKVAAGGILPPGAPGQVAVKIVAALEGSDAVEQSVTIPGGLGRDETNDVAIPTTGNWITIGMELTARPTALGPMWLNAEQEVVGVV